MLKRIEKLSRIILVASIVFYLVMVQVRNASAGITVGGSSQDKYQSIGDCYYSDLNSAKYLVEKFCDFLEIYADADILFQYKDKYAWEQDMKPGKWSNNSIDNVNFMIYAGHGLKKGAHGLTTNALHYFTLNSSSKFHTSTDYDEHLWDSNLTTKEAEWGKAGTKTRWVGLFSCNFLNTDDPYYNHMMQGINICMGFETVMYIDSNQGYQFATDMGLGGNIIDCFLEGCSMYQTKKCTTDVVAKAIYAENARDDTLYNYAYKYSKPEPIGGATKYYSLRRVCLKK